MFNLYFVEFEGLYPVGAAYAVIGAPHRGKARNLLFKRLEAKNLLNEYNRNIALADFKLLENYVGIQIFSDGDY